MPNTYTWTCPRCKHYLTMATPSAPSNCPRCNYPDEGTVPGPDPNADLERDVGPEALLSLTEEQMAARTGARPVVADRPVEAERTVPLDAGWLRAVVDDALEATGYRLTGPRGPDGSVPEDRLGHLIDEVVERYVQPRPTLLCGCPRGTHADTFAAMQEAHPERASR